MKHDDVVRALVAAMEGDAQLMTLLGGSHIYRAASRRELQVPSVEWMVIAQTVQENTERVRVQIDIWTRSYAQAVLIEERVRALFRGDLPHMVGGLLMWTQILDARDMADPTAGLARRMLDYAFELAREM